MADERANLTISLTDEMSDGLRSIVRQLEVMKRSMSDTQQTSAGSHQEIVRQQRELQEGAGKTNQEIEKAFGALDKQLKQFTKPLKEMHELFAKMPEPIKRVGESMRELTNIANVTVRTFSTLSGSVIGIAGGLGSLTVGFVTLGNRMAEASEASRRLKFDIGGSFVDVKRAFEAAGLDADASMARITSWAERMHDIGRGVYSDFYRILQGYGPVAEKVAMDLQKAAEAGLPFQQRMKMFLEFYGNQPEITRRQLARSFGESTAVLDDAERKMRRSKDAWRPDPRQVVENQKMWRNWAEFVEDVSEGYEDWERRIESAFTTGMAPIFSRVADNLKVLKHDADEAMAAMQNFFTVSDEGRKRIEDRINRQNKPGSGWFGGFFSRPTGQEFHSQEESWQKFSDEEAAKRERERKLPGPSSDSVGDPFGSLRRRQQGGSAYAGTPYLVGESGPELFTSHGNVGASAAGGTGQPLREIEQSCKEGNNYLEQMRDVIHWMRQKTESGGGPGGVGRGQTGLGGMPRWLGGPGGGTGGGTGRGGRGGRGGTGTGRGGDTGTGTTPIGSGSQPQGPGLFPPGTPAHVDTGSGRRWSRHTAPSGTMMPSPQPQQPTGGGNIPILDPKKQPRGGQEIYSRLVEEFRNSGLVGVVPPDGKQFGITTGSAEEWARFGTAVAAAESSFNPRSANTSDPGGSFGVFQFAHNQVPGGNAYDTNASIKAFVRDTKASVNNTGGIRGGRGSRSILARRFDTIGNNPHKTVGRLGEAGRIAEAAGRTAPAQPAPTAPTTGGGETGSSTGPRTGGGDGRVMYNPITSSNFMGGVGANSASRGRGQHQGEDWGAAVGTPVYAVSDGVVERIGTDNFGKPAVSIRHDDGTYTRDMHLSRVDVKAGDRVQGGKPYALSGTANGVPHLHHERWSGKPGNSNLLSPAQESGYGRKRMTGGEVSPNFADQGTGGKPPSAAPRTGANPQPKPTGPYIEGDYGYGKPPGGTPQTVPTSPAARMQQQRDLSAPGGPTALYNYDPNRAGFSPGSNQRWYGNLYYQEDLTKGLGPAERYLGKNREYVGKPTDTSRQYGETALKPGSVGWMNNAKDQIDAAVKSGSRYFELDNTDSLTNSTGRGAYADLIRYAGEKGLQISLKNPRASDIAEFGNLRNSKGEPIISHATVEAGDQIRPAELRRAFDIAGNPAARGKYVSYGKKPPDKKLAKEVGATPGMTYQHGDGEYSDMRTIAETADADIGSPAHTAKATSDNDANVRNLTPRPASASDSDVSRPPGGQKQESVDRGAIDKSIAAQHGQGKVNLKVKANNVPKEASVKADGDGAFKDNVTTEKNGNGAGAKSDSGADAIEE